MVYAQQNHEATNGICTAAAMRRGELRTLNIFEPPVVYSSTYKSAARTCT